MSHATKRMIEARLDAKIRRRCKTVLHWSQDFGLIFRTTWKLAQLKIVRALSRETPEFRWLMSPSSEQPK